MLLVRLGRAAAAAALLLAGCSTPCGELGHHASGCGAPEQRYVDPRDSVCVDTRREMGHEAFDAYAQCVLEQGCDDTQGVDACLDAHFADAEPCDRFRLWASACGLEPVGTANGCSGLSRSAGAAGLNNYVTCVTAGGCPVDDDPRWVDCQTLVPPEVQQFLDNCQKVLDWTTRCQGQALSAFPVDPIPIPQCLAEAQGFTVESHTAYADCLSEVDCPDIPARLDCILELRFVDKSEIAAQCDRLVAYNAACGADLGGGSTDVCQRVFPRFTPESFDAYISCLEASGCDDPAGASACAQVLVVQ